MGAEQFEGWAIRAAAWADEGPNGLPFVVERDGTVVADFSDASAAWRWLREVHTKRGRPWRRRRGRGGRGMVVGPPGVPYATTRAVAFIISNQATADHWEHLVARANEVGIDMVLANVQGIMEANGASWSPREATWWRTEITGSPAYRQDTSASEKPSKSDLVIGLTRIAGWQHSHPQRGRPWRRLEQLLNRWESASYDELAGVLRELTALVGRRSEEPWASAWQLRRRLPSAP